MAVGRGRKREAEFCFVLGKMGNKRAGEIKSNKNERAIGRK